MSSGGMTFVGLIFAACWLIAIGNWLGWEVFDPEKDEMWAFPVLFSRIVVVGSIVFAVGYVFWKIRR